MSSEAELNTDSIAGQAQFGIRGKRVRLKADSAGLQIEGAGGSRASLAAGQWTLVRLGVIDVNFGGIGYALGGIRQNELRVWSSAAREPLTVTVADDAEGYCEFAATVANAALAHGVRVESGRGWAIPATFFVVLLVAIYATGRPVLRRLQEGSGLFSAAMAMLTACVIFGGLVIWTWRIYAPRRLSDREAVARALRRS